MGYTVDIDTGGTFTDGFFTSGTEFHAVKTPTTPHDLTVCFMECIKAGAKAFAVSLSEFLENTDLIRFSNTIGTNCIIQRDGSKIGLLVTLGQERHTPTRDADGKQPLVARDMVLGIAEEVSGAGDLYRSPDVGAILEAAQALIDRGARCLVVAFANSELNPANERLVRETIKREYPRDYLGSVPVFLASDISARHGYPERINSAALNAYIHGKLTRLLYKAGEDLRRHHYRGHLFIGHNNGAVARVAKTRAINTYNSGPAAGLLGAREIGALYGASCIISADMGGTSFDLGLVVNGEPGYALRPDVEGFRCNLPMLSIRALGAGGGSIAMVADGRLRVGPGSAGALPGPACFDLGGTEPTVTDANLVLGLLDADYFLGGAKKLHMEKARAAIDSKVARPLNISVEEAARRIVDTVESAVATEIAKLARGAGSARNPLMVVYGGAGPLHSCNMASQGGIRRLVVTPFSAVFSAFSSSLMDVGHLYYRRSDTAFSPGGDYQGLARAVEEMRARAEQDMRGEGFPPESVHWSLELIVHGGDPDKEIRLSVAPDFFREQAPLSKVFEQASRSLGEGNTRNLVIATVGLFAKAKVPRFAMAPKAHAGRSVSDAVKSRRSVYLNENRSIEVLVYDRERLDTGHRLNGPALVESEQTTVWVPEGWKLEVDQYHNAILESVGRP